MVLEVCHGVSHRCDCRGAWMEHICGTQAGVYLPTVAGRQLLQESALLVQQLRKLRARPLSPLRGLSASGYLHL